MSNLPSRESARERRETENSECIGGLRNPRFAQERVPGLRVAGRKLYEYLAEFIDSQTESFVDDLLGDKAPDMADKVQAEVSAYLCAKLHCSSRRGQEGSLRPDLASAINDLSGDPDREVVSWMDLGAPLGITEPIVSCGVFPAIEPKEVAGEADAFYSKTSAGHIYRSAVEEGEWVQAKLNSMVEAGQMDVFPDLAAAERAHGGIVLSKLACLVKEVPGTTELKKRLLVDMLRSGSNGLAQLFERGVLPRLPTRPETPGA